MTKRFKISNTDMQRCNVLNNKIFKMIAMNCEKNYAKYDPNNKLLPSARTKRLSSNKNIILFSFHFSLYLFVARGINGSLIEHWFTIDTGLFSM